MRLSRLFAALLFALCLPLWQAWAAFGDLGLLGAVAGDSSGGSIADNLTTGASIGNIAVALVVFDNISTATGQTSDVVSVTDTSGNTWTKIAEQTVSSGAAADGASASAWVTTVTATLNIGSTVTATFTAGTPIAFLRIMGLTVGAGNTVSVAGTIQFNTGLLADPAAQTISGLTSKEYYFGHLLGFEGTNADSFTGTASYTVATATQPTLDRVYEYRILTGTGDTVNISSDVTDQDYAQIYFALQEAASGSPQRTMIGVGQ